MWLRIGLERILIAEGEQRVDRDRRGRPTRGRSAVREALRVYGECGVQRTLSNRDDVVDTAIEDVCRGEERNGDVMMTLVVPAEEFLAPRATVEI